jgi:putative hemolysin
VKKPALVAIVIACAAVPVGAETIANPASEFCVTMGGRSVAAKLRNGDEIGLCYLPGKKIVEEWTLFRMLNGKKPAVRTNPFR